MNQTPKIYYGGPLDTPESWETLVRMVLKMASSSLKEQIILPESANRWLPPIETISSWKDPEIP